MILRLVRRHRGRAAVLVLVALVAAMVLGAAGPAQAHASLLSTDPAEGAVLTTAPERIRFTFNEAVATVPDGVQVFDASGGPVASSVEVSGSELDVTLGDEVGEGTLVVVWRIVSEDGHPVAGSLTFSVGSPSADVRRPPAAESGAADAPWLLGPARWVGYVGLFLAVGLVGFAVLLLPAGQVVARARGRLVLGARLGAAAAALGWLLVLPLTAVYQVGGSAGSLTDADTWAALPLVEHAVAAAVVLGTVLAVVLLGRGAPDRRRGTAALVAGLVAVSAPAFVGHTRAASPEALVVAADVLHLLAGSVWLGGLVAVAIALPDLAERDSEAAGLLTRFSTVAAGVLAALVVTGTLLGWRILESWSALVDTGYGQLLLLKIGAALVVVGIAAWNRFRLLPRLRDADRRPDRVSSAGLVARTTAVEAVVLVVVLLLTGLLVDRTPQPEADASASTTGPAAGVTGSLGEVEVTAELTPPAVGSSTVTLRLTDADGAPTEGIEPPRVSLSSDQVDLGPVTVSQVLAGTYAGPVVLPSPGTWRLQVSLRTSEFTNPVTTLELVVEDE